LRPFRSHCLQYLQLVEGRENVADWGVECYKAPVDRHDGHQTANRFRHRKQSEDSIWTGSVGGISAAGAVFPNDSVAIRYHRDEERCNPGLYGVIDELV
jgi:hypothetical protein